MKANSQRVKGKNFRDFCGKPLFKWVLDSLLAVEDIDEIIINTDARHILAENGLVEPDRVTIRDRKPEICGDDVSMNLVLKDDVESVAADIYLMTHTTNPLLSPETIQKALDEFNMVQKNGSADSLFTVNKIQARFYREDASPVNHDPANLIPTQNLEPWYEENSNLYLFTRDSFDKTQARIGEKPKMMVTPPFESSDIDTPDDWNMAVVAAAYFMEKQQ
jgi:CMP-N-acetylneuraminic acid synthetase